MGEVGFEVTPEADRALRVVFVVTGAAFLVFAAGLFWRWSWATGLWPWPDGRLSFVFLSSIAAAIAVPTLWIGWTGEFAAARGGALNLGITAAGTALYLFTVAEGDTQVLITAVAFALFVPANAVVWWWSSRLRFQDVRTMPPALRASFFLFAVILVLVSVMLISARDTVFPWPLREDSSVLFGLIFLGAAAYFVAALAQPKWHNAKGQLLGFLAYDVVLAVPFIRHLGEVQDDHRLSLVLYLLVLAYSAGVAVYFLFLHRVTGVRPGPDQVAERPYFQ